MALPLIKEIVELRAHLQQDSYKVVSFRSLSQVFQMIKVFSFIFIMQLKTFTLLFAVQATIASQVKWAG